MGVYIQLHRIFEVYNKEKERWEAVKGAASPRLLNMDDSSELMIFKSDNGYETSFLGDIQGSEELNDRGLPDDVSEDVRRFIEEGLKKDEQRRFMAVSYVRGDELGRFITKRKKELVAEVKNNIASRAYNFFNSKLDRLLMWASKGVKPRVSEKEEEQMSGDLSSSFPNFLVVDAMDKCNDLSDEYTYFQVVRNLVGNIWLDNEYIRMVFYLTIS